MVKAKPCVVCGTLTKRALFKNSLEEVLICSEVCENQYFESLSFDRAARLRSLQHLDNEIAKTRKHERDCWIGAAFGLVLILFGIYLTTSSPNQKFNAGLVFFMIGLVPLTGGALATRYFSDLREKLIIKRRKIA